MRSLIVLALCAVVLCRVKAPDRTIKRDKPKEALDLEGDVLGMSEKMKEQYKMQTVNLMDQVKTLYMEHDYTRETLRCSACLAVVEELWDQLDYVLRLPKHRQTEDKFDEVIDETCDTIVKDYGMKFDQDKTKGQFRFVKEGSNMKGDWITILLNTACSAVIEDADEEIASTEDPRDLAVKRCLKGSKMCELTDIGLAARPGHEYALEDGDGGEEYEEEHRDWYFFPGTHGEYDPEKAKEDDYLPADFPEELAKLHGLKRREDAELKEEL